jgi:hydroxymethylglutaryl-CoA reductase (NADPH)
MSGRHSLIAQHVRDVLRGESLAARKLRFERPVEPAVAVPHFTASAKVSPARAKKLWDQLSVNEEIKKGLLDPCTAAEMAAYQGNIENCLGAVRVPVGVAGPLRVRGLYADGCYLVPLATSEAALVASYHRGTRVITEAGGCTSLIVYEAVDRAPAFAFKSVVEAGEFVAWAMDQIETFQAVARTTTSHGNLMDVAVVLEGNHVYLKFEFQTGDASGQNMVTLATQAICDHIVRHAPVAPQQAYVESNLSGDKKASARAFMNVRGRKVSAEVVVPEALVKKRLHSTPRAMQQYWQMSALGGVLSGTLGVHGHFANGLTALYIATGQDAACVAESAVGITRFELTDAGDLYAAVTLPALMVATVGGGTRLPSQNACLQLMGLAGNGHARALAEVTAALLLAGELSIIAALAAGEFSRAHRKLARRPKNAGGTAS